MISWFSRKQSYVALITAEVDYVTVVQVVVRQYGCGSYYLIYLISRWMLLVYIMTTRVALLENPVFHDKSKHIEIKYHYIRDMV